MNTATRCHRLFSPCIETLESRTLFSTVMQAQLIGDLSAVFNVPAGVDAIQVNHAAQTVVTGKIDGGSVDVKVTYSTVLTFGSETLTLTRTDLNYFADPVKDGVFTALALSVAAMVNVVPLQRQG